jgi:hypothetical protein
MKYVTLLIILILTFSSVFAAGDDDIILRTSGLNNAHAAEYSEIGYTYTIEWTGNPQTDPHDVVCDDNNSILRLSDSINAHIAQPSYTSYTTNVCYGDIQCGFTESDCAVGEICIGSASDYSNAHISTYCSDSGGYAIDICCVEGCTNIDMLCPANIWDELNQIPVPLTQCVEDGTTACCAPDECAYDGACYSSFEIEQIDGANDWWCSFDSHWCPITDDVQYEYDPIFDICMPIQEACYDPDHVLNPTYCNEIYPADDWWTDESSYAPCIDFSVDPDDACCLSQILQGIDYFMYQDIEITDDLIDPTNYIDGITVCGDYYQCGISDGVCPSELADCKQCLLDDPDCCGLCGNTCGYTCGDNIISPSLNEQCDNDEIPFTDCVDANPGYTGGDLSCDSCQIDYSACTGSPGACPLTCTDFGFDGGTLTCTLPDCSDCDTTGCYGEDTCGNDLGELWQEEYDSDTQMFDDLSVEDCYNSKPVNTEHVIDDESNGACVTDSTLCVDDYQTYDSVDLAVPDLCVVDTSCKDADYDNGDFEICNLGNWHDPDESEDYCNKVGGIWDPSCAVACGTDDYNDDPLDGYCVDDDGSLITGTILGESFRGEGIYYPITELEVTVSLKDMSLTTIYSTTADATGYYELEALSETYYLVAEAETYVTYSDILVISGPDTIPEIDMDMSTECNSQCTKNDNICHADCDGVNGCEYPTGYMYENLVDHTPVKELCDQQGEWPVNLGIINPLEPEIEYEYFCCAGESVPTATAEIITTPGGEDVSITSYCRIVQIGGKPGSICVAVKD